MNNEIVLHLLNNAVLPTFCFSRNFSTYLSFSFINVSRLRLNMACIMNINMIMEIKIYLHKL